MKPNAGRGQARALETVYNGQRYRSRLEARWQVAFNAIGIAARYEYQGFDLDDGESYLPDFYLPERCMWAEVKGDLQTADLSKPVALARITGEPVAVVGDIPGEEVPGPHHLLIGYDRAGNFTAGWFAWVPTSEDIGGVIEEPHGPAFFVGPENRMPDVWRLRRSQVITDPLIAAAYREARNARFEHGEQPRDVWRGEIA